MALLFVADRGDTLLKGLPYFQILGPVYYFRALSCLGLSLAAIKVSKHYFQAGFAVFALLCQIAFIVIAHLLVDRIPNMPARISNLRLAVSPCCVLLSYFP